MTRKVRMRGMVFSLALAFRLTAVQTASADSINAFLGAPTGGDVRNDDTGWIGWKLVTGGSPKVVNRLGFWVDPTHNGGVLVSSHEVGIFSDGGGSPAQTGGILVQAIVPVGSSGETNQYAWITIPDTTLAANTTYYVGARSRNDYWTPKYVNTTVPVLDSSFGTRSGGYSCWANYDAMWTGASPAVFGGGIGNATANGGYIGPNIGYMSSPATRAALVIVR